MQISQTDRTEWATLWLIMGCYGLWALGLMLWQTAFWAVGLLLLPIAAAFHTSLQHETIHGHPTRFPWLNEVLVSLPLAAAFPYRRYRDLHLQHHRDEHLTDPFEDPESYFWAAGDVQRMSDFQRTLFELNNTFLGRLLVGPALTMVGFARTERRRILADEPGVRRAWLLHLIGLAVLITLLLVIGMPLWLYVLGVIYPALALTAVRSYAEHQAAENVGARSAVVEAGPFWSMLFLNNNLHIVHHASPTTPWYDLPKLYSERRQIYLTANENTVFMGYGDVWRRFAFSKKQSVDHPLMHRDVDEARTP